MLFDPRWERPPVPPPNKRASAFGLLLAALVPVFIAAYTVAVTLDEILVLLVPVALNVAGLLLTRRTVP